jgi:lysyl-tRNA synthetase class 2
MKVLPPEITLGGTLLFENDQSLAKGQFALVSQGLQMNCQGIQIAQTGLKSGDKVLLQAKTDDITMLRDIRSFKVKGGVLVQKLTSLGREMAPLKIDQIDSRLWTEFIKQVRDYLSHRSLQEVTTPSLVINPGMEPQLEPFATELVLGSKKQKLFIPTSPEMHLKQLLAHDYTDIFEIKTCLRNGEVTNIHQPEFQMLEWYRAYSNLSLILSDLIGLLQNFVPEVGGEKAVDVSPISFLFEKHLGFKLTPTTTRNELVELCRSAKVDWSETDSFDDLFHRLMFERIEPKIDPDIPTIVIEYPPSQAALARLNDAGWADRFELYWKGLEIANAFHELNDPSEQRRRFERDQKLRVENGKTPLEIDENFMRALESGMPPSAGIALGLDRLFMAIYGIKQIENARLFDYAHVLAAGKT